MMLFEIILISSLLVSFDAIYITPCDEITVCGAFYYLYGNNCTGGEIHFEPGIYYPSTLIPMSWIDPYPCGNGSFIWNME